MLIQSRDQLNLRNMRAEDLAQVLMVERNAQVMPWGRLSFEESLSKQHVCRVVEFAESVIGFHVVCAVADELHILNVVVATEYQGQGIGHVLINDIVEQATQHSSNRIFLEVRASNQIAQNLYKQWQFEDLSVRKAYYRTTTTQREDALVLVKHLNK